MESLQSAMSSVLLKRDAANHGAEMPLSASRGDSVLEERFWSLIDGTATGREKSLDRFEIGKYRVDSIFLVPQGAVVVELDGAAFHRNWEEDRERDLELLKVVRAVIRIRYYDLMNFPRATFFSLGRIYPRFNLTGSLTFPDHDDPETATLHGLMWRRGGRQDVDIMRRIKKGQRKQGGD